MPPQYVSAPYGSVCQCQYEIISAPRATRAQAAWRSCPSYGGRLSCEPAIDVALVSVTQNRSCREAYMRSAAWNSPAGVVVNQEISAGASASSWTSASCGR